MASSPLHYYISFDTTFELSNDSCDKTLADSDIFADDSDNANYVDEDPPVNLVEVYGRLQIAGYRNAWEFHDDESRKFSDLLDLMWLDVNEGRLHNSPITNPSKVIDVGAGFCQWAIHFADNHLKTDVLAVDRVPVHEREIPENLTLYLEDFLEEDFNCETKPDTCNLIHFRQFVWCENYPMAFRQARKLLKPGAWVEFGWINFKHDLWDHCLKEMDDMKEVTRRFPTHKTIQACIQNAGFENIQWRIIPRQLEPRLRNPDIRGQVLLPLCHGLRLNKEKAEYLAAKVGQELSDLEFYSVWAQKSA